MGKRMKLFKEMEEFLSGEIRTSLNICFQRKGGIGDTLPREGKGEGCFIPALDEAPWLASGEK